MSLRRIAAVLILSGFVLQVLGFVVGPSGVSQAPDVESALQAIHDQQWIYVLSGLISGLTSALPPIGFVLLALHLRDRQNPWPAGLTAGLLLLAPRWE